MDNIKPIQATDSATDDKKDPAKTESKQFEEKTSRSGTFFYYATFFVRQPMAAMAKATTEMISGKLSVAFEGLAGVLADSFLTSVTE